MKALTLVTLLSSLSLINVQGQGLQDLQSVNITSEENYDYSSCYDQEKNGDEEGIDCGGSSCAPCEDTGIVEDEKRTSVVVYPNPSTGPFNFQSNVGNIETIELFSQNGRLLFTSGNINRKDANVDLTSFKSQSILARVRVNGRTIQKILVKQ